MVKKLFPGVMKVFVIGMIVHFFVHTIIYHGLDFSPSWMEIFWMWKEILVVLGGGILVLLALKKERFRLLFCDRFFVRFVAVFCVLVALSIFLSLGIHGQGLYDRVLAFKYDLFAFLVFLVVYALFKIYNISRSKLSAWFFSVLKVLLIVSIVRYGLSYFAPEFLARFGYSLDAYQWVYGEAPPLHYLTNIWTGSIRNQGLFGGPVSWGFFLVAFWPLFAWKTIKKFFEENIKIGFRTRGWPLFWMLLYIVNVYVTHSRAAWLVFALQSFVLLMIFFHRWWKHILVGGTIVGVLAIAGLVAWKGGDLFSRNLSDDGHVSHVLDGIDMLSSSPWIGLGAGSAGPASYRLGDDGFFNPENQYLQIGIEFGVFGLLLWFVLYGMIAKRGLKNYVHNLDPESQPRLSLSGAELNSPGSSGGQSIGFFLVLGLLGLGVAGMFLHPAVDSQVMYVLMLLLALFLE